MFHKYNLFLYICCFRHLVKHGNMVTRSWNYCHNQTIDIIYLGLLLFKRVIICWGFLVYFEDFSPIIKINDIINILDNNLKFVINPKPLLKEFAEYNINFTNARNNHLLLKDYNKIIESIYLFRLKMFSGIIYKENIDDIKKIWDGKIIKENKQLIKLHKTIKYDHYDILNSLIIENYLNKILEFNMNFGFTSYCILNIIEYLENSKLYIIDENQTKVWNGIGTELLKSKRGSRKYFKVIEDSFTNTLTKFNMKKEKYIFNMIMIDGWSTLNDTLYIILGLDDLLEVGGFICIENAIFKTVESILKYIYKYLPYYKIYKKQPTLVILQKVNKNNIELENHIYNYTL